MRLEEEKTQVSQSLTNLGEFLYSKYQISYSFKDVSTPFIIERAGHKVQEKLLKAHLPTPSILVPKECEEITF